MHPCDMTPLPNASKRNDGARSEVNGSVNNPGLDAMS